MTSQLFSSIQPLVQMWVVQCYRCVQVHTAVVISVSPSLGEVMVFTLIFSLQEPWSQDRYVGGLSIVEQLLPCRPVTLCIH